MPNRLPDDTRTLTRHDYLSDEVYEIERARIFHRGWMFAARGDRLQPGNRTVVELAGESVLLTRDLDGALHALANVCRHRGARLCDQHNDSGQGSLMCPYHAWTYALDGRLIATPHLDDTDVDKASLPLWAYHVREWHGFVFVSLAKEPPAFDEWLGTHCADLLALERFNMGALHVAHTSVSDVAANWKIIVENYQECLHCTRVHPELVAVIPLYRTGWVIDLSRDDGGVAIEGDYSTGYAPGHAMPPLPGLSELDINSYYGCTAFPNMFVDISGTCAVVTSLFPKGPHLTTLVMEFMFAPEVIAGPDFDPTPIVEFNELVAAQDNLVCERVHQGVSSLAFDTGVLTPKDQLVIDFTQHYLAARGPV
ncbi:MAG: aromatic ring-hydroxylating dioxygenase subunit alpha [Ilumatobacteraceae bacterium]